MNRIIFSLLAFVSVTAWAQEPRDSTESVKQFVELQEVVIRGGLPNTRLKAGSMITRIEGTPLAQSGTLGEMLVMVPGMTGTDDSPEVLGKGSPLIYINGRKMRDASELKRLRSEDIRDVEVINNPGAQYDAQVLAVVRIRTRKQQGEGLSLHLTAADEHDQRYNFERPQLKLGANYRTGDIDVFGSLYYFHQDHRQYSTLWDKTMTTEKTFLQQGPYTMTWKNDHLTYTAAYSVSLGKVQTALSYSIKTDRPSFFAMNDAVTYISRYTLQAGNSQLLNERLRELTLNLSYRWLTLGENVSDNGGLKIAYRAFENRMASEPLADVDDFTPAQRFYLAYARAWACNSTPEYTAMLVNSDVHSPARLRVMAALPMIDTWYDAFGIQPTDKMFLPKEKRALVW